MIRVLNPGMTRNEMFLFQMVTTREEGDWDRPVCDLSRDSAVQGSGGEG